MCAQAIRRACVESTTAPATTVNVTANLLLCKTPYDFSQPRNTNLNGRCSHGVHHAVMPQSKRVNSYKVLPSLWRQVQSYYNKTTNNKRKTGRHSRRSKIKTPKHANAKGYLYKKAYMPVRCTSTSSRARAATNAVGEAGKLAIQGSIGK